MQFLVTECDFNVEHADGSFLDHLYFCFEYSVQHYPRHSPLVMLLHSILGTGTNTFAMTADKIPQLRPLMTPWEWTQVEAFPSVLRLLYAGPFAPGTAGERSPPRCHHLDQISPGHRQRAHHPERRRFLDCAELPTHPPGGFPAIGQLAPAPERHLLHPVSRSLRLAGAGGQAGSHRGLHAHLRPPQA